MVASSVHTPHDQEGIVRPTGAIGAWRLHAAGSQIAFDVKKFWGLVTVHGTFGSVEGSASVGEDGSISGLVAIEAASVDTGQAKRDEHLRGEDFFDVVHFPEMSVRVDRVDLTSAEGGTAHGHVTVRGERRPVSFDVAVTVAPDARTAVVSGGVTLDRSRFGIVWSPLRMAAMDAVVSFRLEYRAVGA